MHHKLQKLARLSSFANCRHNYVNLEKDHLTMLLLQIDSKAALWKIVQKYKNCIRM